MGGVPVARDPRALDLAVRGQRHEHAAHQQDLARLRTTAATRRATLAALPLALGDLHRQGGARGLRARGCDRVLPRGPPVAIDVCAPRVPPLHRDLADGSDSCDRAHGRGRTWHEGCHPVGLGCGDRRLPDVLPRRDQHAARLALTRSGGARTDALLRSGTLEDPLAASRADVAALRLLRAQDLGNRKRDRGDHRGDPRVAPGWSRLRDRELQPVLHDPAGELMGDDHRLRAARHRLLPRNRAPGTARSEAGPGELRVNAVSIRGVSKQFKAGVTALQGIDLDVEPGEFVSLIGPSGCGKSTLLRIIGDLTKPTAGTVEVNGKPAERARRDHEYGIVFQDSVLYDWRTVAKNISLPLELLHWSRSKRNARIKEMLELVELTGFEGHHPRQLSGGMQQRVSIAGALSFSPSLLLMDEPFGALDEMTRERLNMELLRIWEASGSTVVFVTHSIPEAVFLSTRVVVMSARPGRVAGLIDVDLPQPRTSATREEPHFFELVTQVREQLAVAGAPLGETQEPALVEDQA